MFLWFTVYFCNVSKQQYFIHTQIRVTWSHKIEIKHLVGMSTNFTGGILSLVKM